ncbi:MAG: hypothetical protein ABSD21_06120 [Rhizomicrobium sp.]|jgi:predicted lipid-binding transport protein (Tim44 family)
MTAIDYSSHVTNAAPGPATAVASAKKADALDFSFADFLDIVNPLEHIPVVSTLYRAITGDRPGTIEKIAGDTLYGGVIGFISSLADTAFQAVTGKNVGDTVLAFLTGDDTTQTASAAPAQTASASTQTSVAPEKPAQVTPAKSVSSPDISALMSALSRKGVDSGTAARAAYAYRRTIGLMTSVPELPPS